MYVPRPSHRSLTVRKKTEEKGLGDFIMWMMSLSTYVDGRKEGVEREWGVFPAVMFMQAHGRIKQTREDL